MSDIKNLERVLEECKCGLQERGFTNEYVSDPSTVNKHARLGMLKARDKGKGDEASRLRGIARKTQKDPTARNRYPSPNPAHGETHLDPNKKYRLQNK